MLVNIMSSPQIQSLIRIHYGPYEAHGVVKHRTERLRGIQEQLAQRGIPVTFVPSSHWNQLNVEVAGQNIFNCCETALEYNSDGSEDPLCHQVIDVIMEALRRIIPSLYDYHELLKIHNRALREEYLEELALYQRYIIESLLQDVVQSAKEFCHNIVKQIIEDAVNFKVNLCRQLTEDAFTYAIRKIEEAEATEICQPVAKKLVDAVVVEVETAKTLAMQQNVHDVIENTIDTAFYSTMDGKLSVCHEATDNAVDEAFYSTDDGKMELAQSAIESALDKAYSVTRDGTTDVCQEIAESMIDEAFSVTKDGITDICLGITEATVESVFAQEEEKFE